MGKSYSKPSNTVPAPSSSTHPPPHPHHQKLQQQQMTPKSSTPATTITHPKPRPITVTPTPVTTSAPTPPATSPSRSKRPSAQIQARKTPETKDDRWGKQPSSSNAGITPSAQQQERRGRFDTAEVIVHDEVDEVTADHNTPSALPTPQPNKPTPQNAPSSPPAMTDSSVLVKKEPPSPPSPIPQRQQPNPALSPQPTEPPPQRPLNPPPSRQSRAKPQTPPQQPPIQTKYAFGSPEDTIPAPTQPQTSTYTAFTRFFGSEHPRVSAPLASKTAPPASPAPILYSDPTLFNAEDLEEESTERFNSRGGEDLKVQRPVVVRMHVGRSAVAAAPVPMEVDDDQEDGGSFSGSIVVNHGKANSGDMGPGGDGEGRARKVRAMHVVETDEMNSHPFGLQEP
ncbi:hypothetical protein BJ742DRAFT_858237 [Cladochytrium replicatum]|nr:hypothetical protein BJ742DRAFT_858237 [Cladochytrium replicatum]